MQSSSVNTMINDVICDVNLFSQVKCVAVKTNNQSRSIDDNSFLNKNTFVLVKFYSKLKKLCIDESKVVPFSASLCTYTV